MTNVLNFAIRQNTCTYWEALPVIYLTKCKWLQRPLNYIARKLGGYHQTKSQTVERIVIERDKWLPRLHDVIRESQIQGLNPTHIVMGYDTYSKLIETASFIILSPTILDCQTILGYKLILHPGINGLFAITV